MFALIIIILIGLWISSLPRWPYNRKWGYYPSHGIGLLVILLIILSVLQID